MPDDLFAASHALMGQKTVTQFWLDKMKEEWQAEAVAAERERITRDGRALFVEPGTNPGDPADAAADGFNAGVAAVLAIIDGEQ